ncbi:MAG: DNA-directed RNA polymerase subunit beta [Bacteroidetes bacterium]|nr:DNA-directed RNA polymerase subunit beta [Bacteroidota bacterium]
MTAKNKIVRVNFSRVKDILPYPDFLDIQVKSFESFFRIGSTAEERKKEGLYRVFQENFPISDSRNNFILEFIDYYIDPPRYSIEECIERGLTFNVPLKVKLKLYCTDPEHTDFETIIQDVYLGTIPVMTPRGTFVINGAERVIVSQLHRSPGVFFGQSYHPNGTKLYSARIIPFKGAWMEFSTDINNVLYAYIDRKKKIPVTTLLRAIGFESDKAILELFHLAEEIKVTKSNLHKSVGRKLAARVLKSWIEDFVDEDTGEVVSIERNEVVLERETIIDEKNIEQIIESKCEKIILHRESELPSDFSVIYNTLQKDPCNSELEAIEYIYRQVRGAEPPDEETARGLMEKLFFSDKRYDLGEVGRYRINKRLSLTTDPSTRILTKVDFVEIIRYLIQLVNSHAEVDDIDHLSNRRVRTVGQFSVGLSRMARTIRERMNVRDNEVFTPIDLINAKTLSAVINSFFGTNQLSQFMDQTNPLSELTHKRRCSALGPGGLSRERAGFEVRDVHYTHYGRLCTIETPEGPNIGLISSLCVYARVNGLGFIETPYRPVTKGKIEIDKPVVYLSAEEEEKYIIAQANAEIDNKGRIINERVKARHTGDFPIVETNKIDLIDVAPNQIASIAASLIPFLEHDDANRALMGSNMMRQAVPLIKPEVPVVGTGLELLVAHDSRVLLRAEDDGVVEYVDSNEIVVRYSPDEEEKFLSFDDDVRTYKLIKFRKTNQNTFINLRPLVKKGERVKEDQPLCEGYGTKDGELALGRNLMVAFMPWKGYNFEDAIVISERLMREDVFTSIHIDEFELEVRDTRRGMEELTSDIPNVSEEATKDLDENGMIRTGVEVKEGDILIGKITPKGETDPSPEEKLLRAIFGDKAGDVKDASLRCPPSFDGMVIDSKLFSRSMKDKKGKSAEKSLLDRLENDFKKEIMELRSKLIDKLFIIVNGKVSQGVTTQLKEVVVPKGTKFTIKILQKLNYENINPGKWTTDKKKNDQIKILLHRYTLKCNEILGAYKRKKFAIQVGDELPQGVIQMAKVFVAQKRKIKVGDKMAGRHGNKGIIAKIVREEDMPFLQDGTPVDIVLNPLGVPSRMNLGQIYETVLGWAGKILNTCFATPIFDGATLGQINEWTDKAGLPRYGKIYLYDGLTGERFDQPATVGIIYMMKLHHMVDDKMHSRSIGPYSLITQQPLGGKAQFGGQRFGEMEVWALEAFGASSCLQEVLTVKSDDVTGRARSYEAMIKGEHIPKPGIPESFNVLMHELKGLGLNVTLS